MHIAKHSGTPRAATRAGARPRAEILIGGDLTALAEVSAAFFQVA